MPRLLFAIFYVDELVGALVYRASSARAAAALAASGARDAEADASLPPLRMSRRRATLLTAAALAGGAALLAARPART